VRQESNGISLQLRYKRPSLPPETSFLFPLLFFISQFTRQKVLTITKNKTPLFRSSQTIKHHVSLLPFTSFLLQLHHHFHHTVFSITTSSCFSRPPSLARHFTPPCSSLQPHLADFNTGSAIVAFATALRGELGSPKNNSSSGLPESSAQSRGTRNGRSCSANIRRLST
jgi:hypothetical protein